MLQTSQLLDNSIITDFAEDLYIKEKFNAIYRFLNVRIPVYARAVGDILLSDALSKDFETNLKISEIASRTLVSKSMVIHSLKLLVDLRIFLKEEKVNSPCTYRLNSGEWIQYSTPEPKNKVSRFPVAESEVESENHYWGVQETPQEEKPINEMPERFEQAHPDYADEEIFVAAANAHAELSKPRPQKVLKIIDGDWFWEVPPNTDVESGRVIEQIMEKEGITVQRAINQVVKLANEVIKVFADLKIAFRITDSPVDACKKLMAAIAKPEPNKDEFKQRRLQNNIEDYYSLLQDLGYAKTSVKFSDCKNGQINLVPIGGITPQPVAIADLMKNHSDPGASLGSEYYTFKEVIENYERGLKVKAI